THHKEQFPTEDSLDRFLVSQFNVYNEKSLKRIHRGFKGLQDALNQRPRKILDYKSAMDILPDFG
ncbi:hypothetical protein ACOBP7_16490, partial [Lactiplantibacillus plantarum]